MRTHTHTVWDTARAMPILKPTAIGRRVEPATLFSLQLAIYFWGTTFGTHVTFYELYSTGAFKQSSIFLLFFLLCFFVYGSVSVSASAFVVHFI